MSHVTRGYNGKGTSNGGPGTTSNRNDRAPRILATAISLVLIVNISHYY